MLTTAIKDNRLTISIGSWNAVTFDVHDRYRVNGSKTMRNGAVVVTVNDFWYGRISSNSIYVKKACEVLKKMGLDPVEVGFIDLVRTYQWGEEIPVEYLDQPQLFS